MSSGARSNGVPSVITFLCVLVIPFFYGIYLTFTNWNAISKTYQVVEL
jgi:raffinose/stachyose/melibiose transport system permease protein